MTRRVLFGVPEHFSLEGALYPPSGLLSLAAAVRAAGHVAGIVDGQIVGEDRVVAACGEGGYDVFGTTILTPLRASSFALVRKIRAAHPSCLIVAGGAHVSLLPEETLRQVPEIDIVVIGEGEATLVDLLAGTDPADVPGVCFRRAGEILRTAPRPPLDPAAIPIPAYDLIDVTPYRSYEDVVVDGEPLAGAPFMTIYSSRGCTGSCSFCSTWRVWRRWRQLPPSRFVDEIELLVGRGVRHFFIADDSMISEEAFVLAFADELARRGLRIRYKIACRADKITPAIAVALRRSGCYEVHVGFESGSQRILDAMNKGVTVAQNVEAARVLHAAGLRVYALMIVGSADETIETFNETVAFLNAIRPDVVATVGGLMLLPGTRDWQRAVREGLVDPEFWRGPEPFPYYTRTFTVPELKLLTYAMERRITIRSRRWLSAIMFARFPIVVAETLWGTDHPATAGLRRLAWLARRLGLRRRTAPA